MRAVAGSTGQGITVRGIVIQQQAQDTGAGGFTTAIRLGLIVATASVEGDLPDVIAEPYADWMWNSQYYLDANAQIPAEHQQLRIKSQRKVEELGDSLWLVFQPRLGGADSIAYDAHVRVLLALP